MTQFPTPSKRHRSPWAQIRKTGSAPWSIGWYLNGRWVQFRIVGETDLPEDAELIGHKVDEDHLEELYQSGDLFFRHAGGGRGFYWTQELEIVE